MEDIKIYDIDMLLDEPIIQLNDNLFGSFSSFTDDYINYIYISLSLVVVLVIGFLIYKFYGNREKKVTFQTNSEQSDCYGGMCYR